jgi:thiaminase (transcriptional activator TenA)
MPFSVDAWTANAALTETIRTMPFNTALAEGTLPEDRFKHYIIQDAHYLIAFGRALAVAAAKADDPDGIVQFSEAAKVAIIVERALHGDYFRTFGVTADEFAATPLSPACHHYSSFLIATAWAEPYPVVLAALLPCFWVYAEIGRDIHARATSPNPYEAWIDTYSGEEFHEAVRSVIATTDRAAAKASPDTVQAMHLAFTRATQLEWMFWDSAWRLGDWPVR